MGTRRVSLILTPLFCLCLIHPVSAQSLIDRQLAGLKGRVKTVRIEIADLDTDGNPDKNGRWLSRLVSYDSNGHKTEDETFYAFGVLSYGKYTYTYDSSGNRIEEIHEIRGTYKTTYIYNHRGELTEETSQPGVTRMIYSYDDKGRLKERRSSYLDGTKIGRQVFEYDEAGRFTARLLYGPDGSFDGKTQVRTYDKMGRIASEANGEDEKTPYYRREVFGYDDRDNIVLEEVYAKESSPVLQLGTSGVVLKHESRGALIEKDVLLLTDRTAYTYELDSAGNWTKQRAVHWNNRDGGWTYETHRTITYY